MSRWRRKFEFTLVAEIKEYDKYGNPIDPPRQRTIEGCTDWPNSTDEDEQGAVQTTDTRTLSLPRGEAIIPSDWDLIYPDGKKWKIIGEPYAYTRGVIMTIERKS
ncbi:hypothetical protein [Propionimicrobium sp. PCR01-08-3]|uniref:hypothetical protein n=1 Tax=Propionimicrobium sp. PCR01-08-3 TaxID=3052086 RepID=UPI00255CE21E|nr:hypothetical protein [Propionimicrobium sp. PCR01-08-3]WIY81385.1 hypothetical protein QQ658_07440 [Propionimicrobium sp. PCR01-08-3]WIY81772.1 hypothetical protein QQ658_09580 [Propionimicrobium sp. PCR01-08-3]